LLRSRNHDPRSNLKHKANDEILQKLEHDLFNDIVSESRVTKAPNLRIALAKRTLDTSSDKLASAVHERLEAAAFDRHKTSNIDSTALSDSPSSLLSKSSLGNEKSLTVLTPQSMNYSLNDQSSLVSCSSDQLSPSHVSTSASGSEGMHQKIPFLHQELEKHKDRIKLLEELLVKELAHRDKSDSALSPLSASKTNPMDTWVSQPINSAHNAVANISLDHVHGSYEKQDTVVNSATESKIDTYKPHGILANKGKLSLFSQDYETLSPLGKFLHARNLLHHLPAFEYEEITMEVLPLLTKGDLEAIGIHSMGARMRIFRDAKKLTT
jgi:hypothetical protein